MGNKEKCVIVLLWRHLGRSLNIQHKRTIFPRNEKEQLHEVILATLTAFLWASISSSVKQDLGWLIHQSEDSLRTTCWGHPGVLECQPEHGQSLILRLYVWLQRGLCLQAELSRPMATRKQFFSGHSSQFTSLRCNPAPAFTVNVSEACETLGSEAPVFVFWFSHWWCQAVRQLIRLSE